MLWEASVLNKMYRCLDFKIVIPSYSKLSVEKKKELRKDLSDCINDYCLNKKNNSLFNLNIDVSSGCALFDLKNNNNAYYFSYNTNAFFYIYTQIFEKGEKYLKSNYSEDLLFKWECYFLHLLFLKEENFEMFSKELTDKFEMFFKYNNFILSQGFSYFDIVLLSLLFNANVINDENKDKFPCIQRWLIYADKYCQIDKKKVNEYLKNKEKENLFEEYRFTSNQDLVQAVANKSYDEVIDFLQNKHENVNSRRPKDFKTLAHICCYNEDKKMFEILIKFGCNLESYDLENMTPLYDGIFTGSIPFVEYMIEELHANLFHKEIQNRTPFYWATCTGNIEMIKYLLTKPNIDINCASFMGRTPISKACWNGDEEVVKLLCEQPGIKLDIADTNGRYPIHNAVWGEYGGRQGKKMNGGSSSDSPQSVLELIKHGCDVEVIDKDGNTPFMIAVSTNGIDSLKILVDKGVETNKVNIKGETGIVQAVQYGNFETLKVLLDYIKKGKNIDLDIKDNNGMRAIDHAILYKRVVCLKLLFEFDGRYNNIQEIEKLVNLAIMSNSYFCFEYLLEAIKKFQDREEQIKRSALKCLGLENFYLFNYLYKVFKDDIEKIIKKENDYLIVIFGSYLIQERIQKKETESQDTESEKEEDLEQQNSPEPDKESQSKESKNETQERVNYHKDVSFEQKNKIYEEMLSKKMIDVSNEYGDYFGDYETSVRSEMNTLSDKKSFETNILDLINSLTSQLIQEKKAKENFLVSEDFVKILIKFSYLEGFKKFISEYKDKFEFQKGREVSYTDEIFDEIEITKHFYKFTNIRSISPLNDCVKNYKDSTILSVCVENLDDTYFNSMINFETIKEEIFSLTQISKSNILHIIFSQEEYDRKMDSILKIVQEEKYRPRIIPFLKKIDEINIDSLTPLDILLKSLNHEKIEKYTEIFYSLQSKYNSLSKIQLKKYKVLTYTINSKEVTASPEYKQYVISKLKLFQSKMHLKNKDLAELSIKEISEIALYKITEETEKTIEKIINIVSENKIEDEFKISNPNYKYKYIDNEKALIDMCNNIKKFSVIGVDSEFSGEQVGVDGVVCLIQISTIEESFAVDSLVLHDLINTHLKPIFEDENILKVLHGCDNDIFWLLSNFDIFMKNTYDTARAYMIYQNIILNKNFKKGNLHSLGYLVKFILNAHIDKSYQKTNWKIRPFTNNMMQYALNDSKTVLDLYFILQGLFLFLNSHYTNNQLIRNFYINLQTRMIGKEKGISIKEGGEEMKTILFKIAHQCIEIKKKIKDKFNLIDITIQN